MLDEESENGAIRTTERRCKLNVEAPYILKKVCPYIYIRKYGLSHTYCDTRSVILLLWKFVVFINKCHFYYY